MKVVELNDCLSMQFIHQPNSQIQVHPPLPPNLGQEPNQLMRLIPIWMHVALATILQSSSTQLNRQMFVLVMNPLSPSQMRQLCLGLLLGMTPSPTKPAFWSQTRPSVMAQNQITSQSTQTKSRALVLIVGTTPLMKPGQFPLDQLILISSSLSLPPAPKSNSFHECRHLTNSCIALTFN